MPPVITLAACYTGAAASEDGASFAAQLCERGAAAVIATETSITDTYATRLLARVYGTLARSGSPDVVAALAGRAPGGAGRTGGLAGQARHRAGRRWVNGRP